VFSDGSTVCCADVRETVAGQSVLVEPYAVELYLPRPANTENTVRLGLDDVTKVDSIYGSINGRHVVGHGVIGR